MKTLYALVLLAFVGLAILGCTDLSDQIVTPVEKASTLNSAGSLDKGDGVLHSATGSLHLEMPHEEPYKIDIVFNAIEHKDGSISGNMRVFDHEAGFWINGEVIDLKVDNGNRAKLSCRIKKSQLEFYTYLIFVVVDNGQGNGSLPDQASWIYGLGDTPNYEGEPSLEEFIAMDSDEFLALFDGWLFEYLDGNIQVR